MHALGCRWWLNNQRELSVSRLWPEFHWQELDRRGTHAVTIGQKSGQGAESEANSNTLRTCPNYANGVKVRGAARTVGAKTNFHLSFPPPVFNTTTRDLSLSFLGSFFMGVIRQFFWAVSLWESYANVAGSLLCPTVALEGKDILHTSWYDRPLHIYGFTSRELQQCL